MRLVVKFARAQNTNNRYFFWILTDYIKILQYFINNTVLSMNIMLYKKVKKECVILHYAPFFHESLFSAPFSCTLHSIQISLTV